MYLMAFNIFVLFNLHFIPFSRVIIIFVFLHALQTVSVGMTVCWCFRGFLSTTLQLFSVSMTWSLTCGSHFAAIAMFNVCCGFLVLRIRCINLLLRQLIVDEPISNEFLFLPSNQQMLLHDFFFMKHYQFKRNQHDYDLPSPTASSSLLSTHFGSNIQRAQIKWLSLKRTQTKDASIQACATRRPNKAKQWSFKLFDNHGDINIGHNLNKFVNNFKLTEIKTIFRM